MYLLGIDVGGTKIEAAVMVLSDRQEEGYQKVLHPQKTYHFKTIARQRIKTMREEGFDSVISRLLDLVEGVLQEARVKPGELIGAGVGLPGAVNPRSQMMSNGNTGILIGKDLRKNLMDRFDLRCPVYCENDANCFALAEAVAGVGVQFAEQAGTPPSEVTALGVILGTGVGGGCFAAGKLMSGRRGAGGEWGHIPLYSHGIPCYCGQEGCAESYLSGTALEALYATKLYSQIDLRPNAREIFTMAQEQEPASLAIVKQYLRNLGKFLAYLTQAFDPHYIVLGGGMSRQNEIYEHIQMEMQPYLFIKEDAPQVYKHALGDSAGVIGAGLLSLVRSTI